jgi:glycosyltransferase involved in cell wall biosynthesis
MTLLSGRQGGTAVYANALLDALKKRDDVDIEVITAPRSGGLATLGWIASGANAAANRARAGVLHSPAFVAPLRSSVPSVLTIHDLSLGRMPSGHPFEWRMFYRFLLPRIARGATFVITPTEATRDDVIAELAIPPDHVVVVPHGIDGQFFETTQRDRSATTSEPLIVFPGPPIGRKNLDLVLRVLAAARAPSALARARLEITGALAADFPEYQHRITDSGLIQRVRWLGKVPFEEIADLYARADLLVYASFLEGFGFPPLEAMATGTPVVASNASCLPEVLDDAALLVDPNDDAGFAAAVESVLTSPDLRGRLIEAGKARAAKFTWVRCADLTADVYERAARSKTE